MTHFEQCLATLAELAATDDPKSLDAVDACVRAYLASPDVAKDAVHPCDDLADALMKRAPDTENKGHILDILFRIESPPEQPDRGRHA